MSDSFKEYEQGKPLENKQSIAPTNCSTDDERKVTLTIRTSPEELRVIAMYLETEKKVRINWYHTRYIFINDEKAEKMKP